MNAKQDDKVGMFTSVKLACAEDSDIWAGVPAFGAAFAKFNTCVERIQEFAQKQAERSADATADKRRCRESMCDAALVIAGAVRAYAIDDSDLELAGKVDFSRTTLLGGRDRTSAEKCQTIHRLASENVGDLSEHGVTPAKLKSLQTKIDAYVACLQRPRQIIAESKTATAQLEAEIETADRQPGPAGVAVQGFGAGVLQQLHERAGHCEQRCGSQQRRRPGAGKGGVTANANLRPDLPMAATDGGSRLLWQNIGRSEPLHVGCCFPNNGRIDPAGHLIPWPCRAGT